MRGSWTPWREALADAVEAARRALADRDDDEVPAGLRRIVRSSDRHLPPPLVARLLGELDTDPRLREDAAERLGEGASPAAVAFLRRDEPGWWRTVAEAYAARALRRAERRAEEAQRRRADAERRLRDERARRREAERAGRAAGEAPVPDRSEAWRRELAEQQRARVMAEREVESLREELRSASRRIGELTLRRDQLAERLRRSAPGEPARIVESAPREPAELARFLDRVASAVAPYRAPSEGSRDVDPSATASASLPPGVAPDTAAALDAVIAAGSPIIVDGHNVLGAWDRRLLADPEARRELVERLGRLARAGAAVTVVFDSELVGERRSRRSDDGVEVRFAEAGSTADDEIVAVAGPGVTVVTNDRELRERAEARGALALWGDALVDRIG